MRTEITRTLLRRFSPTAYREALSRHRADEYAAFISYTNEEPDRTLALDLFDQLEQYRVPQDLTDERLPAALSNIFFATEYGPAGIEIETMLRKELAKSRYLIVLCSSRARNKPWVVFEIRTFIELHGSADRILPVLVEGDPRDAIPQEISSDRVAANLRASSVTKARRLLRSEKLRLLAPILGRDYHILRQRHIERMLQRARRAALLATSVLLIVTGLTVFAFLQWRSASARLYQALSIFDSVDTILMKRTQGRFGNPTKEELFHMVPGDREASLFALIYSDLAFVSLADRGIDEARIYFDKADAVIASASISPKERAKILAGFAYEYSRYADDCMKLHWERLQLGKDATIKDLAAKPDTLVAIMTDKDYLQEATGAYRLAITRIEHVIHIDGNTEEYAQFRTHANQRLANAKAAPLLERLGSLQDKAQKRSAEGKFQEALVLWDSILREGDGLPKQIPEYAVQKGHMMLARAAVLGAMGKLEEAEQQLVEAERLVNEGNLKALAVDLLEGIGKVRSIMRR